MSNKQNNWKERFNELYGDDFEGGFRDKIKSFIQSEIETAYRDGYKQGETDATIETLQEVEEKIRDCGHQQEDDTIWCNMDEILSAIKQESDMRIYRSTEYIKNPKVGDLKLSVNSMWDFGSRSVCFETIKKTGGDSMQISYDLKECIEVKDGIVIGGTKKVKNTKWKPAEITTEIAGQLSYDGYSVSSTYLTNPTEKL